MMQPFKFLEHYGKRPEQRFYLAGVGWLESMQPQIINRPKGTWDWLIMYFHTPIELEVGGVAGTYPAGTLMIWDDTQGHFYGNRFEEWSHSWIHCQGAVVGNLMKEAGLSATVYPSLKIEPVLETYLPLIHEERLRADMSPQILESLFLCFLHEVGRIYSPKVQRAQGGVERVKRYLESHYNESIRLDDLCVIAAMSKPHLILEFKKTYGVPPIDYLIDVRLGHARRLLLNRNLSVGQVADMVGYDDIYYFSKIFKKRLGKSPSSFR